MIPAAPQHTMQQDNKRAHIIVSGANYCYCGADWPGQCLRATAGLNCDRKEFPCKCAGSVQHDVRCELPCVHHSPYLLAHEAAAALLLPRCCGP